MGFSQTFEFLVQFFISYICFTVISPVFVIPIYINTINTDDQMYVDEFYFSFFHTKKNVCEKL